MIRKLQVVPDLSRSVWPPLCVWECAMHLPEEFEVQEPEPEMFTVSRLWNSRDPENECDEISML